MGADSRGFDGGKLVDGCKRHVVVDTLGLLLGVVVTAADTGHLVEYGLAAFTLVPAIVKRSDDREGAWCCPSGGSSSSASSPA
ncbi:transposase [Streptomyces sp. NPDC055186]